MSESFASPDAAGDPADYCARQVRAYDRDRYLADLFVPAAARPALMALHAFNIEIAKVRESVSEPMLGEIRLQWWREALDGVYGGAPRAHAVVRALAAAVGRHALSRERLERMIDGRAFDLEDRQPADLAALVAYADATSGELSCLALEALGVRGEAALEAARDVGTAWALAGLLRAVPFHAAQRRCYLPATLTAETGLAPGALYDRKPVTGLAEAVRTVADAAAAHLARAEAARAAVPRAARAALLPRHLVGMDLRRLARAGHDPFRLAPSGPLRRQLRLMLASLRP